MITPGVNTFLTLNNIPEMAKMFENVFAIVRLSKDELVNSLPLR